MPSVYVKTFGCQMNEQDSEIMKRLLVKEGYQPVGHADEADLILINTCSIRAKAYQKAMSEIGRQRRLHPQTGNRGPLIGVTGCVASQEGGALLKRFPQIDFVLGTDQTGKLPEVVQSVKTGGRIARSDFQDISDYEFPAPLQWGGERQVKAYVTIMKGCDNACSFCIVPFTRGKEVSRPPEDIILEIHQLEPQGVREVMLLGQNVNSYGKRRAAFADLLRRIDEQTGIARLRFTSPHPKDLSPELIHEYEKNTKLCPHLHLPVQSGSNRVLKRMRRAYTREVYLKRVDAVRRVRPDLAITTDLIVGFPGETEADFEATLDLVATVGYDQSYSFIFSPRPGTEAALLADDVPSETKKERLQRLQIFQETISLAKNRSRIGQIESVLVEGPGERPGQMTGRSAHGRIVNFDGEASQIGAILKLKIRETSAFSLKGELWK